jgi:hypothetical protein
MSMADYIGILQNTTYTGPPRLRYVFQVVQTQTTADYYIGRLKHPQYV